MTRAQVLALLGAPRDVQAGSGSTVFSYTDVDGERVQIWFHDGVAVQVTPPGRPFGKRRKIPDEGPYLGQPVAEFIHRTGPPEKLTRGVDGGLNLSYPSGMEVHLAGGIVTWVRKGT